MVVYFKNESNRFSSSSNQGLIEQGAQVKEGQKLLRIPNLLRMQVNTKVHEAMVARIKGDVRVAGAPAYVEYRKLKGEPDAEVRLQATLDETTRARLGGEDAHGLRRPRLRVSGRCGDGKGKCGKQAERSFHIGSTATLSVR